MSFENDLKLLIELEVLIRKLGRHGWKQLEALIDRCRPHHHPHPRIVSGRFDGPYTVLPTGEILVAQFQIQKLNTSYTGKLAFTADDGSAGTGPVGTISSSDPAYVFTLSADGQSYNVTAFAVVAGDITATWHDPSGAVADFTATFSDQPPTVHLTGSFGAPVEGNTP